MFVFLLLNSDDSITGALCSVQKHVILIQMQPLNKKCQTLH